MIQEIVTKEQAKRYLINSSVRQEIIDQALIQLDKGMKPERVLDAVKGFELVFSEKSRKIAQESEKN